MGSTSVEGVATRPGTGAAGRALAADDGSWRYRLLEAGATVTLAMGAVVRLDDCYAGALDLAAG